MYRDANMTLSGSITGNTVNYQTVTGASAVLSTNTIDKSIAVDMGEGNPLYGRVSVGTVFAGLTALTVEVIAADDAALTTNVTVIGSTGAIAVAKLTAGSQHACVLNPRIANKGQRYVGMRYTPTGTGTTGTVYADIGIEIDDATTNNKAYASGYAVL